MHILGISAFYHDSAACLVRNGEIVSAAQEERFTRKKHDGGFPFAAIDFCLKDSGITISQVDLIAFYEKPFLKFERLLETYMAYAPAGLASFLKAMPPWMKQKLSMREYIRKELRYDGKIIFPEHHESHAASAFYPSPFQEAAVITMDGVGEWTTTSYGTGRGNEIELWEEIEFPHSLGLLYSAFTYYTGFKVNSGEYKVMGLAPYGEPRYKDMILDELIEVKEDGSFRLNMSYFNYCAGLTMTNRRFDRLFGGTPRSPETKLTQKEMDLARSLQEATGEIVLKIGKRVHKETGMKNLTMAGGVALNCVANGRLMREGPFENIWIQPAAGDAGGAIGAALLGWYRYGNNPRSVDNKKDAQRGSYLGPAFDEKTILDFLNGNGIVYHALRPDDVAETAAELIAKENVVGWFQGRMEFGPRALGARSILGDARSPRMQSLINLKVKRREGFRPFAPAVLAEKVSEYFDLEKESPYMLLAANVRNDRRRKMSEDERRLTGIDKLDIVRSDIPAVTHVDYSARIQTVHRETNPLFHDMISAFEKKTGCAVVVNTSFNVRGEPIVCTPEDAYRCFMRTNIDCLIMGNFLLYKNEQKPLDDGGVRRKDPGLIALPERMILLEEIRRIKSSKSDLKKFGLTIGIASLLIGILLLFRHTGIGIYWGGAGLIFLAAAFAAPVSLKPLNKIWMTLAIVMGWVMTRVLLTVFYYTVLTPMGLIMKLSAKDLLDRKADSDAKSYWQKREKKKFNPLDYEKQY